MSLTQGSSSASDSCELDLLCSNHLPNVLLLDRLRAAQCEQLAAGVDVLISTPGRLLSHLERGSLRLDNTHPLVMDEVDVLAGRTETEAAG